MKKFMKKSAALLLALMMCMSIATTAFAAGESPFKDVPTTFWAYDAIKEMSDRGVVKGYGDGTFGPRINVSGAHFTVMLSRAFFADTVGDHVNVPWYGAELTNLMNHKVMDGTTMWRTYSKTGSYSDKEMSAPLTRYDMAQMMYNVLVAKGVEMPSAAELEATKAKIADFKNIPADYVKAVLSMYTLGTLAGFDSVGSFRGEQIMNRGQACTVMSRLIKVIEGKDPTPSQPSKTPDEVTKDEKHPGDNIPAIEDVSVVHKQIAPEAMYVLENKPEFAQITDAADVNEAIDAGKSNAYPTLGVTEKPNQNGYKTDCTIQLENCYLVYEAVDIINEMCRQAGLGNCVQWTISDADEEEAMVLAKIHPESCKNWCKAANVQEAMKIFMTPDAMRYGYIYGMTTGRIKYIAVACYVDGNDRWYGLVAQTAGGFSGNYGAANTNYFVFD